MAPSANTDAAIGLVTAAGLASLFLPSMETAWGASPGDRTVGAQVRTGTVVYVGFVGALSILYALKTGGPAPLLVGAAIAAVVVGLYYHALSSCPADVRP